MRATMKPEKQGFAVELYFDFEMENTIRGFREKIYAAGVDPVSGKMGDRPHVSLAVFNKVDMHHVNLIINYAF